MPIPQTETAHQLQDGVTLCTLGVGTTFGASVMPGKLHSVSVVTSDDCTLLRVRRADFQEIFNEQSHLISNVESSPFCSLSSLGRLSQQVNFAGQQVNVTGGSSNSGNTNTATATASSMRGQPSPAREQTPFSGQLRGANGLAATTRPCDPTQLATGEPNEQQECQEELDADELNLDSLEPGELTNQLMRVGWVLRVMMLDQRPQLIRDRRVHLARRHSRGRAHAHHLARNESVAGQGNQAPAAGVGQARRTHRQLVSMASSSQLLASGGRRVANYVASSFMGRAAGAKQSQAAPNPSTSGGGASQPSHALQASGSLDLQQLVDKPLTGGWQASAEPVAFGRCMVGKEMVDWLLELSQSNTNALRWVSSRLQAVSMWQVLLEQGVIFAGLPEGAEHAPSESSGEGGTRQPGAGPEEDNEQLGRRQSQFCDDQQAYYKFWLDRQAADTPSARQAGSDEGELTATAAPAVTLTVSATDVALASESLWWSLKVLSKLAPDAGFRLILSKRPQERTIEEVDIVYEELQHLKALAHLTNSVKKELAACVTSEHHGRQNTVLFNQGDSGHSWYIILRGSVNVVIVGKGVVCTLHEGDDFGKLALVNDAPRAATIVTNEPNCYFLRVDKHNFNTILRDVEANTVRLKEHGKLFSLNRSSKLGGQRLTNSLN